MKITDSIKTELIKKAFEARKSAYAPYSNFKVGAALISSDERIYLGCNIENASYGATNCAERTAIFKAVSEGVSELCAIAIVGGNATEENELSDFAFPCGICRQVMREFSNPEELVVLVAKSVTDYREYKLNQLLPESFGPEHLD